MLVLSRKKNESIVINGNIRIEVLQIKGKQIRIGITAPSNVKVLRGELPGKADVVEARPAQPARNGTQVVECDLHNLVSAVMASV